MNNVLSIKRYQLLSLLDHVIRDLEFELNRIHRGVFIFPVSRISPSYSRVDDTKRLVTFKKQKERVSQCRRSLS